MRSPLRWAVWLLGVLLAAVTAHCVAKPYVRATSLIVRVAGLDRQHPTLAALETDTFAERSESVPSRFGALRARLYTPTTHTEGALVLTPGVNALGIDEPRLVTFARNLAASGFIVLTPELPDLRRYLVTARSTDMIEDAAAWFSGRTDLTRGHRPGLAGISFAGGLSVVAAGRPRLRGHLGFVFSLGGHANFPRVVRYLCGDTAQMAAGIPDAPRVPTPHDYGVAVVALDLADRLVPADQAGPLKAGILTFLHASHLALFDRAQADREFEDARAQERTMGEPARTFLHLVNTREVRTLGPKLLPEIATLGDEPALSPDQSPVTDAPLFLLHGLEDNVVPAMETLRLARHAEPYTRVTVLLTPLVSHAEVDRPARPSETVALIRFWAGMLML
jgi:hypothetical protein